MFRYEYSKVFRNSYFAEHLQKLTSEVFLRKTFLKICSEFTRELPCQSVQSKFIKIALRHGCSPVNLMHIFRALFPKNTSGWLLLELRATVFLCFFFALAWTLCSCLCSSSSSSPSVFYQPCPGLPNCKSVPLILKISQYDWGDKFSFFQGIQVRTDIRIDISIFIRPITTKFGKQVYHRELTQMRLAN